MWQEIFMERLASLRKSKNLNQKELGDIVGLSLSAISDMERGKRSTTMETFVALADYFHVSIDYLVGRDDIPNRKELSHE